MFLTVQKPKNPHKLTFLKYLNRSSSLKRTFSFQNSSSSSVSNEKFHSVMDSSSSTTMLPKEFFPSFISRTAKRVHSKTSGELGNVTVPVPGKLACILRLWQRNLQVLRSNLLPFLRSAHLHSTLQTAGEESQGSALDSATPWANISQAFSPQQVQADRPTRHLVIFIANVNCKNRMPFALSVFGFQGCTSPFNLSDLSDLLTFQTIPPFKPFNLSTFQTFPLFKLYSQCFIHFRYFGSALLIFTISNFSGSYPLPTHVFVSLYSGCFLSCKMASMP